MSSNSNQGGFFSSFSNNNNNNNNNNNMYRNSNLEEGFTNNLSEIISPSSLGLSPALLAVLSYFFGWFGGFIIMLLEKKNLFVIFHGWQSFVSGVIAFFVQLLFVFSGTMYRLLWIVYLIFTFAMIMKVIADAPNQRLFKRK